MRSVKATCKKCRSTVLVDIGTMSREQVTEQLDRGTYSCSAGQHVELGSPATYLDVDWNSVEERPDPPSDEQCGQRLIREYGRENVFYLGDEKLGATLGIAHLRSVGDLMHLGFGDFGNDEWIFVRTDSPTGSTHFHVRHPRS